MNSGLGLIPISFDWTQITYAGQPLTTPFYITANVKILPEFAADAVLLTATCGTVLGCGRNLLSRCCADLVLQQRLVFRLVSITSLFLHAGPY
jgi:hypothetical protein